MRVSASSRGREMNLPGDPRVVEFSDWVRAEVLHYLGEAAERDLASTPVLHCEGLLCSQMLC